MEESRCLVIVEVGDFVCLSSRALVKIVHIRQ